MKSLTVKKIIPLTVISFALLTKWWDALPTDAPETIFHGFPLAYTCQGWHTSMSVQIFILELIIDILFYFIFWFIIVLMINHFLIKIKTTKWITIILYILSGIIATCGILLASIKNNIFYLKRHYEIRVVKTGYEFGLNKRY